MQEIQVQSLGQEDALEEEMAAHSSMLAWEISRTEEPGRYSPWGCKSRTKLNEYTTTTIFQYNIFKKQKPIRWQQLLFSKNERYWLATGPPCSDPTLTSGHQVSAAGGGRGAQSLWWSGRETPAEPLPKDPGHGKPLTKTHSRPAQPIFLHWILYYLSTWDHCILWTHFNFCRGNNDHMETNDWIQQPANWKKHWV